MLLALTQYLRRVKANKFESADFPVRNRRHKNKDCRNISTKDYQ
jgi:hypothetical protein